MVHHESWKSTYFVVDLQRSRSRVTKNIAGVGICTFMSAGFFSFDYVSFRSISIKFSELSTVLWRRWSGIDRYATSRTGTTEMWVTCGMTQIWLSQFMSVVLYLQLSCSMCARSYTSLRTLPSRVFFRISNMGVWTSVWGPSLSPPVSYTHLTLPTILRV